MAPTPKKEELLELAAQKNRALPRILLAASECAPLAKTGGLADVVGTLPKYLRKLGVDARVMIPYHKIIKDKYSDQVEYLFSFEISLGWRRKFVGVNKLVLDGTYIWLIENDEYFGSAIYLPDREGEQYAFFTRAVLEALPRLDFIPDIIHCNDWHTGMLPLLLKTQYLDSPLAHTKTLLSIHNIAYQGLCSFGFVQDYLGVPDGCFGLMERFGQASFLKAGVVMADRVSTVSPSYAKEICTWEYGEGLDRELSMRGDVCGIANGIDKKIWSPGKDPDIPVKFTKSKMVGKVQCKTALMEETGLEVRLDSFLGIFHNHDMVWSNGDAAHVISAMFTASIVSGEPRIDEESYELRFFARDEIPELFAEDHIASLEAYFGGARYPLLRENRYKG